jgi:hypothetical protein
MGLGDLVSKVLVEFKGDTSDLKSKLKDLQGVEKERAKALVDDIEKTNKGYDSAITKLGHVGLALDTLGKAYAAAKDAMKVYGETLKLETATAGINIDRLSEAFGGLINRHDLMTMAAQTSNGVLALNQGQMETLGKAAIALKNNGFELEDALKKLTEAAVKGSVGGLDDLGLKIKEGSSRAETLKNMMTELNRVIGEGSVAAKNEADAVQQLSVQWENATAKAKGYAAQAILAMSVDLSPESIKRIYNEEKERRFKANFASDETLEVNRQIAIGARRGMAEGAAMRDVEMPEDKVGRSDAEKKKLADEAVTAAAKSILRAAMKNIDQTTFQDQGFEAQELRGMLGQSADMNIRNDYGVIQDEQGIIDGLEKANADKFLEGVNALYEKRTNVFETVFGSIETVDMYTESFRTLGSVFEGFTAAVGAGYEALITDSEPVGKAIKKMAADQLMAIGKTSAVRALQETALGVGSLALGPIGGVSAAAHFKAAALHAGVALAAGAAAHQIGTSAQVAASDKAAEEKKKEEEKQKKEADKKSGKGSGGSSRTDENGRTIIVAYLNPFANGTPSERGRNARNLVQSVLGGDAGSDS